MNDKEIITEANDSIIRPAIRDLLHQLTGKDLGFALIVNVPIGGGEFAEHVLLSNLEQLDVILMLKEMMVHIDKNVVT